MATRRWLVSGLAAFLIWLGYVAWSIHVFATVDRATKADCIIVLGAAVQANRPSPVFEERLRHALHLYRSGYAGKLIFTGGIGEGQAQAESSVAQGYAISQSVPATSIFIETKSRTTQENLAEASKLMQGLGLRSAILVSDPYHLKRATLMARDLGMDAYPSATPTSRYRSFSSKFGFLMREVYFYHHYLCFGQ